MEVFEQSSVTMQFWRPQISHGLLRDYYKDNKSNIYKKTYRYTVYFIWKLLYMFRVVPPPIIRSANNCFHSIWYLSHRYCYLPV
jgi:hypothetical protein